MMKHALAVGFLVGVSALALTPAYAQTSSAASTQTPATSSSNSDAAKVDEVVVTGSRTVRNGYQAPTPVTVARTEELQKTQPTDLPDALNTLPQFLNSDSPSRATHNYTTSGTNGNFLNLRGTGAVDTLILFDGQRMPPTNFLGLTDVDVLPQLLIQRVDIVTGGASAVYGSDAVAGIVNFVLDKDFTGVKGEVQGGESQRGDNGSYRASVAFGTKFLNDNGHLLASFEDYHNDGMLRSDRAVSNQDYFYAGSVPGSTYAPGSPQNPYSIWSHGGIGIASQGGVIVGGPDTFADQLDSAGNIVPFNPGTPTGTPAYYSNGDGFFIPNNDTAIAPIDTKKGFARVTYDLTPNVTAFVQGLYSHTELDYATLASGFVSPTSATLFSGNPYLSSDLQNYMTTNSLSSVQIWQYPFAGSLRPTTTEDTDFYMVSAGLDGHFGEGWAWNVTYNHGNSDMNVQQRDTLNWRNAYAALDVVNGPSGPTCNVLTGPYASQYAGCQPLNISNPSAAALKYVLGTSTYEAVNQQDDISGVLSGPIFKLPAGEVIAAFGGEFRTESLKLTSNSNPALLETTAEQNAYFAGLRGVPPGTLFYFVTNMGVASASEKVAEGFGELSIPVLKDLPFAKSLDLNVAGRVTHYSTSGTVETWKLGATWQPIDDILFRVVQSEDIRAPNLYELYAGAQSNEGQLYDPVTNNTANVYMVTKGNPNLQPEKSQTFSVGAVIQPHFIPGLSFSIDYYRLKIKGEVGSLTAQQIVNNCYANSAAPECALITRATPTSFPTQIDLLAENLALTKTDGIDFDLTYRTQAFDNPLSLRLYANYLDSLVTQQYAGAPYIQNAGYGITGNQPIAYPKWRSTLFADYQIGKFDVSASEQYIGGYSLDSALVGTFVNPKVGAVWYTNATVSYTIPRESGRIQTFLTVNNLFDKQPPLIPGTIPGLNYPTIISLYDIVGRSFLGGVRFQF